MYVIIAREGLAQSGEYKCFQPQPPLWHLIEMHLWLNAPSTLKLPTCEDWKRESVDCVCVQLSLKTTVSITVRISGPSRTTLSLGVVGILMYAVISSLYRNKRKLCSL